MTRLFSAVAIGGIAGGSLVAGEPAISMQQALSMVTASIVVMLWLNSQFASIRAEQAKEHEKNRVSRVWFVASINLINQHLRLKSLPMPNDEQTTI